MTPKITDRQDFPLEKVKSYDVFCDLHQLNLVTRYRSHECFGKTK